MRIGEIEHRSCRARPADQNEEARICRDGFCRFGGRSRGLTPTALADGTVALPPGGPNIVYQQDQSVAGANPYTPFGTNPYGPFGVWTP
jgi:hypothetical protein